MIVLKLKLVEKITATNEQTKEMADMSTENSRLAPHINRENIHKLKVLHMIFVTNQLKVQFGLQIHFPPSV